MLDRNHCISLCVLVAAMVLICVSHRGAAAEPGVWYVAPGGNDSHDCQTPEAPCATMNAVLAKATFVAGDEVRVAQGWYVGEVGDRQVVLLDRDATLTGGWDAAFTTRQGYSVIDGQSERSGVPVQPGVAATMDHFRIGNSALRAGLEAHHTGAAPLPEWATIPLLPPASALPVPHSPLSGTLSGGPCEGREEIGICNNGTFTLTNSAFLGLSLGWGIWNDEGASLHMADTVVSGAGPTGFLNFGNLSAVRSYIYANGIGLSNQPEARIVLKQSGILYNNGWRGNLPGGLHNRGVAILVNSTVSHNSTWRRDEHHENGYGGGIYNAGGTVYLLNTSVSYNAADRGAGIYNGTDELSGRAGPIYMQNSLLAENFSYEESADCGGLPITSQGYNLIGTTAGCDFQAAEGDLLDVPSLVKELTGEPPYLPVLRASPAVDAGNPAGCTDQSGEPLMEDIRGLARDDRCDIGSYEYIPEFDPFSYLWFPLSAR